MNTVLDPVDNPNSGQAYEQIFSALLKFYKETFDMVLQARLADGYPPGSAPISSPREQFDRLQAMKNAGDPGYLNDPAAQAAYARLAARFNAVNQLPLGRPGAYPGGYREPQGAY